MRSERLFLIVDKPLTRIMPELHEDNDDFIINNKVTRGCQVVLELEIKNKNKLDIFNRFPEEMGL